MGRRTTTGEAGVAPHRRDVQGLRAVAVLLVVADHAGLGLDGGFVGVDVFLVVSGYLITLLMLREVDRTGRLSVGRFYARRARRILPAATLVLVAVLVYAAGELAVSRVAQLRTDATWSALFAANVHVAEQGVDYFTRDGETSPFQHYWSLAVEEQFYLVWPLLLAALLLVGASRRTVGLLLAAIVAGSLAWSVLHTADAPVAAYYSSTARAWELGVGALLAVHHASLLRLGPGPRRVLGVAGLLAVGVAAVGFGVGSAFPGWRAAVPVLGTAALLAAGAGGRPVGASRGLGVAPLVRVGDLSYSIYLWHWPVLVLGPQHAPDLDTPAGTAYLLGLTLLLSVCSYHLVEDPARRSRWLSVGHRGLVLWPAAVAVALASTVWAEHRATTLFDQRVGATPVAAVPSATVDPPPATGRRHRRRAPARPPDPTVRERLEAALASADSGAPVPFPLQNLPRLSADSWHLRHPCNADGIQAQTRVCPLGAPRARRTLVVHGDSRAGQWLPALDVFGRTHGYRVLPVLKYGCPPYDVPMLTGDRTPYESCDAFRAWARRYIADVAPDVVVLGAESPGVRMLAAGSLDRDQTWTTGAGAVVDELRGRGATVVLLADVPVIMFDPESCLADPDSTLRGCLPAPFPSTAEANRALARVAADRGAAYLDITPLICVRGRCPLVVDGVVTYSDEAHVSVTWALAVAEDLGDRLARTLDRAAGGNPRTRDNFSAGAGISSAAPPP